jgi:isopenicillin N synthase-like dioxygenase
VSELFRVIDLESPSAGSQIDAACRDIGFFQVVGHGVDPEVVAGVRAASAAFFALPPEAKTAYRATGPDANRGYSSRGSEATGYSLGLSTPPDLFEAFNTGGGRMAPDSVRPDLRGLYAPDIWPAELPGFRSAMTAYFEAMTPLAGRLLEVFAAALGLEPGWFAERVGHGPDTLRTLQYETQPDGPDPDGGQYGMGPHTDFGVVTILLADPLPGLQVMGPDGAWHDLIAADGAFIINIGDLIAQWTNDRWISSLHRVLPPARRPGGPAIRRAIPFFKEANPEALVACLESCCTEQDPAHYQPVLAGDHLLAKLVGARTAKKAETASTAGARAVAAGRPAS